MDPHKTEKLDPNPDRIRIKVNIQGAFEDQNGSVEGRGRSKWRHRGSKLMPRGSVAHWSQIHITLMRIRIRIDEKSWIRIRMRIRSPEINIRYFTVPYSRHVNKNINLHVQG
jgi:hypothetical protein